MSWRDFRNIAFLLTVLTLLLLAGAGCGVAATPPALAPPVDMEPTSDLLLPTQSALPGQETAVSPLSTVSGNNVNDSTPVPPMPLPEVPENRLLTVEWPGKIRVGDSDIVRLTLELDTQGNLTPTAQIAGNQVRGEPVQIPNLYDTHNLIVETRLDIAGVEVVPSSDIDEALRPGRSLSFFWSVRPSAVGDYRGTLWVHLIFIPIGSGLTESSPEVTRSVLSAQQIEIQAVNFLGLGGAPARVLGGVGTLVGSVLGLDNVVSWLWKRVSKKKTSD